MSTNNPLKQGTFTENSVGIGTVTRGMVRVRAVEKAEIAYRPAYEVSKSDWEQAKRELTGGPEDSREEAIDAAPESERWNPIHGSTGHKSPVTSSEDEDDEGRSDSENLVEQGVREAEHDQMLNAARMERLNER